MFKKLKCTRFHRQTFSRFNKVWFENLLLREYSTYIRQYYIITRNVSLQIFVQQSVIVFCSFNFFLKLENILLFTDSNFLRIWIQGSTHNLVALIIYRFTYIARKCDKIKYWRLWWVCGRASSANVLWKAYQWGTFAKAVLYVLLLFLFLFLSEGYLALAYIRLINVFAR